MRPVSLQDYLVEILRFGVGNEFPAALIAGGFEAGAGISRLSPIARLPLRVSVAEGMRCAGGLFEVPLWPIGRV